MITKKENEKKKEKRIAYLLKDKSCKELDRILVILERRWFVWVS